MTSTAVYATREEVKRSLDIKETARANLIVDRAIETASRNAEALCHVPHFYPVQATRYFDWPNSQYAEPWRLWLDDKALISVDTLASGGVTIANTDFILEPNAFGPPYNQLQLKLSSSAAFGGGATHQQDIAITGLWGHTNTESAAGQLAAAVASASASTVQVDATGAASLGVGTLLRIDTERMRVTGRQQLTTGQTLQAPLIAKASDQVVGVTNGAAFAVDEVILLDAERMLIDDIAGNSLIVRRAWDGTTLAEHTASTVYASRILTVSRGVLGTTAAEHALSAPVARWEPPGPVRSLTVADAENILLQDHSGWFRVAGGGSSSSREATLEALEKLRTQVYGTYGRKGRVRSV